ncbi:MAG: hypothetical protein ACRCVU_00905 [Flavobacterium sp.]
MFLVVNKSRCILLVCCLISILGCKKENENEKSEYKNEEVKRPEYIIIDRDEKVSSYQVEGVDAHGVSLKGNVTLKGEVGAGYLVKDSLSPQLYIEVKRVQEGGLIGTDTNGVEYQLSFK